MARPTGHLPSRPLVKTPCAAVAQSSGIRELPRLRRRSGQGTGESGRELPGCNSTQATSAGPNCTCTKPPNQTPLLPPTSDESGEDYLYPPTVSLPSAYPSASDAPFVAVPTYGAPRSSTASIGADPGRSRRPRQDSCQRRTRLRRVPAGIYPGLPPLAHDLRRKRWAYRGLNLDDCH